MSLDEIISHAIPLNMSCNIKKQQALALREKTKERIQQWIIERDKRKWEILEQQNKIT